MTEEIRTSVSPPPSGRPSDEDRLRSRLLTKILSMLEARGWRFAVLGDPAPLPGRIRGDVDLVIEPDRLDALLALLTDPEVTAPARLVQVIRHEPTCYFCVLTVQRSNERPVFLQLDVCSHYRRYGRRLLPAEVLLEDRAWLDRRERQIPVPPPRAAFVYYLLKKIEKRRLTDRHGAYLSRCFRDDPDGCERLLRRFGPPTDRERILEAARTECWDPVRGELGRLRTVLRKRRTRSPLDWVKEIERAIDRWRRAPGLLVAVLGPDGSGKSSVAGWLPDRLENLFWRDSYHHFRPHVGRSEPAVDREPVTDPHEDPPRGWTYSNGKLVYYVVDSLLGHLTRVRPELSRNGLVIFDRYFDDVRIDPLRYRFGGSPGLVRALVNAVPRPDLLIVLDAPVDTLRRRKQEVPAAEVHRQRTAYRTLVEKRSDAVLVDADQPLQNVVDGAVDAVLEVMHTRTKTRYE